MLLYQLIIIINVGGVKIMSEEGLFRTESACEQKLEQLKKEQDYEKIYCKGVWK